MFIIAGSMALTGTATTYEQAVLYRFLTGAGAGGANVPIMGLLTGWFGRERRGLASGIAVSGSSFGLLVTGMLVPAEHAVSANTLLLIQCEELLNQLAGKGEAGDQYIRKPLLRSGGAADPGAAVQLGVIKWVDELVKGQGLKRPSDLIKIKPKPSPAPTTKPTTAPTTVPATMPILEE